MGTDDNLASEIIEEINDKQELPLATQYQSAWNEHNVRITQRQAVIQTYLTAAGVIYGFWFNKQDTAPFFLAASITFLTLASSVLIWAHNRVIQKLANFLNDCERLALGSSHRKLFYWGHENPKFHHNLRHPQRLALYCILIVTDVAALGLALQRSVTVQRNDPLSSGLLSTGRLVVCVVFGVLAVLVFLSLDMHQDAHRSEIPYLRDR